MRFFEYEAREVVKRAGIPVTDYGFTTDPAQIQIAKKVFSPDPDEVLFAKKVLEAIPDGRGVHMIDGKMQDDATWKQCKVMVNLAEMLAKKDPELAAAYGFAPQQAAEPETAAAV